MRIETMHALVDDDGNPIELGTKLRCRTTGLVGTFGGIGDDEEGKYVWLDNACIEGRNEGRLKFWFSTVRFLELASE